MQLAIASPVASAYSETFIHMQMERLPCVMRIHGGPIANETLPGGPIQPLKSLRGLVDMAVECGLRGKRWEGPQSRELTRRMRSLSIDTLLANYGPAGVALAPICAELGIRLFVHFHGYDAHKQEVVTRYRADYQKLGDQVAGVIVVSERMKKQITDLGVPQSKIHLIRCGVDIKRFQEKIDFPKDPLFFGVGRFVDKKAPYLTIMAFKQVHDKYPEARLILGGTGELLETSKNLAYCLGMTARVEFPGVLKPDAVADMMRQATAFVQHSITPGVGPSEGDSEGTPVAVLEALTTGLPVISTRHAGIGEVVIDGENGLLVEERDVDGMAKAMVRLAGDSELSRRMGERARKDAIEKYTSEIYLEHLQKILSF